MLRHEIPEAVAMGSCNGLGFGLEQRDMALDRHRLIEGMLQHYPFVIKNFKAYAKNLYRRKV